MKIKTLFATLLTLALFTAGHAQTLPVVRVTTLADQVDLGFNPRSPAETIFLLLTSDCDLYGRPAMILSAYLAALLTVPLLRN
jgi:hypothetical protein